MTTTINRDDYPGIPKDFPIEALEFPVAGVQPRLSLVEQGGKYFAAGTSPQEVKEDYREMADFAAQVMAYCETTQWRSVQAQEAMLERESRIMSLTYGIRPSHVIWILSKVRLHLKEVGPASDQEGNPMGTQAPASIAVPDTGGHPR